MLGLQLQIASNSAMISLQFACDFSMILLEVLELRKKKKAILVTMLWHIICAFYITEPLFLCSVQRKSCLLCRQTSGIFFKLVQLASEVFVECFQEILTTNWFTVKKEIIEFLIIKLFNCVTL